MEPPGMDEQALRRLRERSGLRLDAQGRFWHEGVEVTHPRVVAALRRGLGRDADGRPTLRLGREWCFLRVDDVLRRAGSARCEARGDALSLCALQLDDGTQEHLELAPGQVALGEGDVLYARLRGEWTRLLPGAHAALGRFVAGDPPALLTTAGRFPLGPLPPVDHGPGG